MNGRIDRRGFLRTAGTWAGVAAIAPSLPGLLACAREGGARLPVGRDGGYGPLVPAGDELALPEGFEYRVFGREGSPMADGHPTPRAHDGMAAFPMPDGSIRLIRNHEDRDPPGHAPLLVPSGVAYDPLAGGGTTTLVLRPDEGGVPRLERDFASLGGTILNCAGGPTPWGTWLSCEETTQGVERGWSVPHGYIFEVPVEADVAVSAIPVESMGRFTHEAVAVDPRTGIVYETEDLNRRCGFYRFIPDIPGVLANGGRLEMLAVDGSPGVDLRVGQRMGVRLPVSWVPIDDPDPADAEHRPTAVAEQGLARGAARFSRLEGCWYADDSVYFHSTNGGAAHCGQVWRYTPAEEVLILAFESPSADILEGPDNLTVSPRGGLLICEDTAGVNHLRGLTPDGHIFDFARNILNRREFAGACFSPDGRYLFVNIQGDLNSWGPGNRSMTLVIWGPWEEGSL